MKSVAILHYASPPIVGGVEKTIYYHALGLADIGYRVRVVSGNGGTFDERVETVINPLFNSQHPVVLQVQDSLAGGTIPYNWDEIVQEMTEALEKSLGQCEVCIVHNIISLHKNLALTTALYKLCKDNKIRIINWCHDISWTNSQYLPELHHGFPWDLLRQKWPHTRYVTVSESRQIELADVLNIETSEIQVVMPGVDFAEFLSWTEEMLFIEKRLSLLDAELLLLLPARLTRRKNIEFAIHVMAEIRQQSRLDSRLIVTGPPGPHNPNNTSYLSQLLALRDELKLQDCVHFIYELQDENNQSIIPDDPTMANLYLMSDALFFPSQQEGFGIPVLEAGIASIPVFCSEIPPLRLTGQEDVNYFDPQTATFNDVATMILSSLYNDKAYRLRVRVRKSYRWDVIIHKSLVPLIDGG